MTEEEQIDKDANEKDVGRKDSGQKDSVEKERAFRPSSRPDSLLARIMARLDDKRFLLKAEACAGAALLAAGGLLFFTANRYLVQVAGLAALLMGLVLARGLAAEALERSVGLGKDRRVSLAALLSESWGPLLILALTVVIYWPLVKGYMPWMFDHTVHQYKGYLLAEHLIPSGRLVGWTHLSGAGYPAGQLYPILGDLLTSAVRYLTFKGLTWEATYSLTVFLVLLLGNMIPYYVGRRLAGPVAGVVAALLVMVDRGGFREGGWIFTVQYGVWPLSLGTSLGLLSLERMINLVRERPLEEKARAFRGVPSFALVVAACLMAHPINLLLLFVAVLTFGIYMHFVRGRRGDWLKLLSGVLLGVGLAAFWFLPYMVRAGQYSAHVSNLWQSLPDTASGLLSASLFENIWAWALCLGVLGACAAMCERRPGLTFLSVLSFLLLLASSLTVYAALDVERWLASVKHVQFQRFVIFIKLIWAVTAGFLVQRLFFGMKEHADGEPEGGSGKSAAAVLAPKPLPAEPLPRLRRRGFQLLALLVFVPFVTPSIAAFITLKLAPLSQFTHRDQGIWWMGSYLRMVEHLKKARKETPASEFFRVAYMTGFNDHDLANGPVLTGLPQVKCSFIPSETYKHLVHLKPADVPRTDADFKVMNVKYILARGALPASIKRTRVVMQGGGLTLYEYLDFSPARATMLGPGQVRVKAFGDEELRFEVTGAGPGSRLVVHTPIFPSWEARVNGSEVPITAYDGLAPNVKGLMQVPVKNGVVVFRYCQTFLDILSKVLTVLALLLLVALAGAGRGWGWAEKGYETLSRAAARFRRPLIWAGAALATAFVFLFVLKRCQAPEIPKSGRSLTWELSRARVFLKTSGGARRCRFFLDGRYLCGTRSYQYVGPVSEEWNLKNRRGLWAHPHPNATLVIAYPDTMLGSRIDLDWGLLKGSAGGRGTVHMTIFVDDREVAAVTRKSPGWAGPRRIPTDSYKGKRAAVRFEIRAADISARHFAFDARIMP